MTRLTSAALLIGVAVMLGVGLRLVFVIVADWRIDYDEAMVGLLANRVLRGEWSAFLPGETNIGTLEPLLLSPLFAIFGSNVVTFRAYSLLMGGLLIATAGALGIRAFGKWVGVVAALLTAVAPPYLLVVGLKTWGATVETMLLGAWLLLAVDAALRRYQSVWEGIGWLALGAFIAGVTFWVSWLGVYYWLPVLVVGGVVLWRRWLPITDMVVAVLAFVMGSAPFWAYNFANGFESFARFGETGGLDLAQLPDLFTQFVQVELPQLVSATVPAWGEVSPGLVGVALVVSLAGWGWLVMRGLRSPDLLPRMLAIFALAIVPIYLLSPFSRSALNPWGIDATGRYLLMLHTAIPVGVALLAVDLWRSKVVLRYAAPLIVVALVAVNLAMTVQVDTRRTFDSPYYDRLPDDLSPLIAWLDGRGISHVWTDVGIAHVLMFQTQERVLAADYYDAEIAGGVVRFPEVFAAVSEAQGVALVVPVLPGQDDPPVQQALREAGVPFARHTVGGLAVFTFDDPPDMAEIAAGLGYQY